MSNFALANDLYGEPRLITKDNVTVAYLDAHDSGIWYLTQGDGAPLERRYFDSMDDAYQEAVRINSKDQPKIKSYAARRALEARAEGRETLEFEPVSTELALEIIKAVTDEGFPITLKQNPTTITVFLQEL